MNVTEFNQLIEKIQDELKDKKSTFSLHNNHYVLRNGEKANGISFIFTGSDVGIEKFELLEPFEENGVTKYTSCRTTANSYYILTHKQCKKMLDILNKKFESK